MAAGVYNFEVEQGTPLNRVIELFDESDNPIMVDGYAAQMHVRRSANTPMIELMLSTSDDSITMVGNTIALARDALAMRNVGAMDDGVYDLFITPPSGEQDTERIMAGSFVVVRRITREQV